MLKRTAFLAAAVFVLAQPAFSMQTVNGSTSGNGAPRFADPVNKDSKDEDATKKSGVTLGAAPNSFNTPYGPATPGSPFGQQRYTPETARTAPTGSCFDD